MIFDGKGEVELVQVCYELHTDYLRRILGGLWEAMQFFDKKNAILVIVTKEDDFEEGGF